MQEALPLISESGGTPSSGRSHKTRSSVVVRYLLGTILLFAAALKTSGLAYQPVAASPLLNMPGVQAGIILTELLLGIWLLAAPSSAGAWIATLALFLAFTSVSARAAWLGEASCGCFGKVKLSPNYALAIDVAVLSLLTAYRPGWQQISALGGSLPGLGKGALGVGVLAAIALAVSHLHYGSLPRALAELRGERLTAEPALLDFGDGHSGEAKTLTVRIRNWTGRSVRLVGGTSDCSCITTSDLPADIAPEEQRQLSVTLVYRSDNLGTISRQARLFTDDTELHTLVLRMTGRVIPSD